MFSCLRLRVGFALARGAGFVAKVRRGKDCRGVFLSLDCRLGLGWGVDDVLLLLFFSFFVFLGVNLPIQVASSWVLVF